jgi:hypothetical protein
MPLAYVRDRVPMRATLVLLGVVLLGTLTMDAGERLNVRVSPKVSYAPADLFIYVSLENRAENRVLRVSAISEDFFRSSEKQLDGENSARVTIFNFRQLPSGSYDIEAALIGSNGRATQVARCDVIVL